jgi:hypothetical protein
MVPLPTALTALPVLMARIVEWDQECGIPLPLRPSNGR